MTKSVKHKKIRRQEFQKLKLKAGRKLKKALNETKTDFKSRKILLKEQLAKKDPNAISTKKNLNLKDLKSRLTHHSVYVRQDGLDGMKEIVNSNSKETLTKDIAAIVQSVVPCILDKDQIIRRTAVKIIDILLTKVGTLMNPYLGILSSHLSCAMVHLNSGVQTDSLHLMGSLIKHVPTVIAKNANTLLENFIFLIARKINKDNIGMSSKGATSKNSAQCHLISNPNSTHATTKWRIQLLKSLSGYLGAILSSKGKITKSVEPTSVRETIITGCLPPLLNNSAGNAVDNLSLKVLDDEAKTKDFAISLTNILFEVWAEIDTGSEYSVQGNPLNALAVEVLMCITQIILHLWRLVELAFREDPAKCKWFMNNLRKPFNAGLAPGFPYSAHKYSIEDAEPEANSPTKQTKNKNKFKNINITSSIKEKVKSIEMEDETMETKKNNSQIAKETKNLRIKNKKAAEDKLVEDNCQKLNINLASIAMLLSKEDETLREKVVEYYIDVLQCERPSPYIPDIVNTICLLLPLCHIDLANNILKASIEAFSIATKYRKSLVQIPLKATEWSCERFWNTPFIRTWVELLLHECSKSSENTEYILLTLIHFKLRRVPGYHLILKENRNLLNEAQARQCGN